MKLFKKYILILAVVFCFNALNVFAFDQSQIPDVLRLQPIPSNAHPSNPGSINKSEANSENNSLLLSQLNQYEFDASKLDPNTSYIDTTDHLLFVADTDNNRVLVFDLDSNNVLVNNAPANVLGQPDFTTSNPGTTQSKLDGPTGITFDPLDNKLFVADTDNNRIMVFDTSSISNGENAIAVLGQPDFTTSNPGTTQPKLDSPYGLDFDRTTGTLFVTDTGNNRVVTFNVATIINGENAVNVLGQPNFTTSGPGSSQSRLNSPVGIAYDSGSGKLFVADAKNNRVMVFGAASIGNGENAVKIIDSKEFSSSFARQPIIARMESKPKNIPGSLRNKNIFLTSNSFWLTVLLAITILAAVAIFYAVKIKNGIIRK